MTRPHPRAWDWSRYRLSPHTATINHPGISWNWVHKPILPAIAMAFSPHPGQPPRGASATSDASLISGSAGASGCTR